MKEHFGEYLEKTTDPRVRLAVTTLGVNHMNTHNVWLFSLLADIQRVCLLPELWCY